MTMKFYLGTISCQDGEREHNTTVCFKTPGEPYKYLNSVAKSWYQDEDVKPHPFDDSKWEHHGGEVMTWADGIQEVSEMTFLEVQPLITEM